jgi:hypothetical protein
MMKRRQLLKKEYHACTNLVFRTCQKNIWLPIQKLLDDENCV